MALVIDTISSTDTTASFNVVNFGSARLVEIALSLNGVDIYYQKPYMLANRSWAATVEGLTPGTTYDIRAVAGSDNVTKTVTTTGSPTPTPTGGSDYWGSPWGSSAYGGIVSSTITTSSMNIYGAVSVSVPKPKTITGAIRISKNSSDAVTGAVRIGKTVSKTISGAVNVMKPFTEAITGAVNISGPKEASIDGAVYIYHPQYDVYAENITGGVRVEKTGSKNISGGIRITNSGSATIEGGMTLVKPQESEITGSLRVYKGHSSSITGAVRIRVATPEKLPQRWEDVDEDEPLGWSEEDKSSDSWKNVEKANDGWAEVEKTSEGWSSGEVVSQEWHYPLEDSA